MLEKKLTEMNEKEIQKTEIIVQRTQDLLIALYTGAAQTAIKTLFIINGGGVVTLLAYMHTPPSKINLLLCSLGSFLIGLLLAVIVVAIDYYVCWRFHNNYQGNIKKFNEGGIKLIELQVYSNGCLSKLTKINIIFGYTSAFLFVLGCFFGVFGYYFSIMP